MRAGAYGGDRGAREGESIGRGRKGSVLAEESVRGASRPGRSVRAPPARFPTNEEVVKALAERVQVGRVFPVAAATAHARHASYSMRAAA